MQRGTLWSRPPWVGWDEDAEKGQAHSLGSVGDGGGLSLLPGAGGDGVARQWQGLAWCGVDRWARADLGCWSRLGLCPCFAGFGVQRPCLRQDPAKGCVDRAAKRDRGACGSGGAEHFGGCPGNVATGRSIFLPRAPGWRCIFPLCTRQQGKETVP